jgi:hypothetical protein
MAIEHRDPKLLAGGYGGDDPAVLSAGGIGKRLRPAAGDLSDPRGARVYLVLESVGSLRGQAEMVHGVVADLIACGEELS